MRNHFNLLHRPVPTFGAAELIGTNTSNFGENILVKSPRFHLVNATIVHIQRHAGVKLLVALLTSEDFANVFGLNVVYQAIFIGCYKGAIRALEQVRSQTNDLVLDSKLLFNVRRIICKWKQGISGIYFFISIKYCYLQMVIKNRYYWG